MGSATTHGEPTDPARGSYLSYGKGKDAQADQGELAAAFDGSHGWWFKNRSSEPVKITLSTRGDYQDLKELR